MIETARLSLRRIAASDLDTIAALDSDERVMTTLGGVRTRAQTSAWLDVKLAVWRDHGFGRTIATRRDTGAFVGIVGLGPVDVEVPSTRGIEVAWRLAFDQWGNGFATEAASAIMRDAFGRIDIEEILAITTPANARSLAVMTRLGMTNDPEGTFEHPSVAVGHSLRSYVVYRMRR